MSLVLAALDLAGTAALLLWGIRMLQTGVLRTFGPGLRRFLGMALADRPRALLAGCVVTAALQSSTATGLMISRFVADGSVRPVPALAALLGAGVGTALVVQALSFDLVHLAWGIVLAGAVLFRWSGTARLRDLGRAAVGLGLMLLALHGLVAAAAPFVEGAGTQAPPVLAGARPALVMAAAGALAWGLHSSVAVVLLAMPLAAHGTLGLDAAAAAVLGANLGTALNPVLEGAQDRAARRLSLGSLMMRACLCLPAFALLDPVVHALLLLDPSPARIVANLHAALNMLLAAAFLPVLPPVARGLERMLPDRPPPLDPGQPVHLRAAELDVPALAIEGAAQEALRMAGLLGAMLEQAGPAPHGDRAGIAEARRIEASLDKLHTALREHLASLDPDALTAQDRQQLEDVFTFATKHAVALGLRLIDAPPPTAKKTAKPRKVAPDDFTERYPNIAGWIKDGWIEIGRDGHSTSTIRVLDEGGLVWEGGTRHRSMDKILQEADDAIADWMQNN